jgi:hypothetical protein
MALTQLAKSQWQPYLDRVSKALGAKLIEIEITGLGLGDQIEVEWLPLLGVSYEPKDDMVLVTAEGIEHRIPHPKRIHVDQDELDLHSIEVVDADGEHHILIFKEPVALPAP